jgi:hypothetical protein
MSEANEARSMRNSVVDQTAGMDTSEGDKLINTFERT